MEDNKIRIGITQGDINGVGYEVILKTFSDPTMLELCTPIIYGSPKVAAYHRKALDIQANFSIVNSATEAGYNRLSVVNCTDDEVKVEFSKPDPEAGKAALGALERAIEEYREGLIDVIVTAPINKHTIQSEEFSFPGHTEYIEERLGNGDKSLMILMKNDFRVALVTTHIPVREIATTITKELIQEKLMIFHRCLKQDFGIGAPRIAVLSLNPHAGDGGLLGMEEQEVIIPAMKEMEEKGILCYGPYAAELDKDIISFFHFRNYFFPASFANEALGTSTVGGMIVYPYVFGEESGKYHSPTTFGISSVYFLVSHCRITYHKDSDDRFVCTKCRKKNKSRCK